MGNAIKDGEILKLVGLILMLTYTKSLFNHLTHDKEQFINFSESFDLRITRNRNSLRECSHNIIIPHLTGKESKGKKINFL